VTGKHFLDTIAFAPFARREQTRPYIHRRHNMALLQRDLVPASGDLLITLDTDTNIEWLSLRQTVNLSISDVRNGSGGYTTTYGFRYANGAEVQMLWNHAGITRFAPNQPVPVPDSNSTAIKKLLDWMGGATSYPATGTTQTQGIFMVPPPPGHPGVGQLWFFTNNPGGSYATTDILPNLPQGVTAENYRDAAIASYLVRNHVAPVPPRNVRANEK
jgi:hypothetical protein